MANCNNCKSISITEGQQTNKQVDHICLKYMVKIIHRSNKPKDFHYYIYPCPQCDGKNFEQL